MSDVLGCDLLKRVERYESAVGELRAAHKDVQDVLVVDLLFDRWKQIGSELGFGAEALPEGLGQTPPRRELVVASADTTNGNWDG
jgi:hypothetical protein